MNLKSEPEIWNLNLKSESEIWIRNLNLKSESEIWIRNLNLKSEIRNLNLKSESEIWIWNLNMKSKSECFSFILGISYGESASMHNQIAWNPGLPSLSQWHMQLIRRRNDTVWYIINTIVSSKHDFEHHVFFTSHKIISNFHHMFTAMHWTPLHVRNCDAMCCCWLIVVIIVPLMIVKEDFSP